MKASHCLKLLILFGGLATFSLAFAGGDISGGGGNGIVCFKNAKEAKKIRAQDGHLTEADLAQVESIESYDLYEARLKRGLSENVFTPQIMPLLKNEGPFDYVKRIENRFMNYLPAVSNILMHSRELLPAQNITYIQSEIAKIDDMNERGRIDSACFVATMARNNFENGEHHLVIDQRLFNHKKHSKLSRAVLILHELLYMASRRQDHFGSGNTREFLIQLITTNKKTTIGSLMMEMMSLQFSDEFESGPYPTMLVKEALLKLANCESQNLVKENFAQDVALISYLSDEQKRPMINQVQEFAQIMEKTCPLHDDEKTKEALALALHINDEWMFKDQSILEDEIPLASKAKPFKMTISNVEQMHTGDSMDMLRRKDAPPGGGEVLVCFKNKELALSVKNSNGEIPDSFISTITKVEMLDLFEAKKLPGEIFEVMKEMTAEEYFQKIIKRLEMSVPGLALIFHEEMKELSDNHIFLHEHGLHRVDDANTQVELPPECALATMASNEILDGKRYLYVDFRLYAHPKHSNVSKAFMRLHEYLYMRARDHDHADSSSTRTLVGMITNTGTTTTKELAKASVQLGLLIPVGENLLTYPETLTQEIADNLSEAARDALALNLNAEAIKAQVLKIYLNSWQKLVLNIPGATFESKQKLDFFLQDFCELLEKESETNQRPNPFGERFWHPNLHQKIHTFFDLNYFLPLMND